MHAKSKGVRVLEAQGALLFAQTRKKRFVESYKMQVPPNSLRRARHGSGVVAGPAHRRATEGVFTAGAGRVTSQPVSQ
jgi:hypothetical protein